MLRAVKLLTLAGLLAGAFVAGFQLAPGSRHGTSPAIVNSPRRPVMVLAQPAFAQAMGQSFLEKEAGISCYVNLGEEIDLAKAKSLYKVLEDETDTYTIGTVELSGYNENWWPHVWIHRDGWIVVYYSKDDPTSKLMHWFAYERAGGGEIGTTTLREALLSVANGLELDLAKIQANMHYYHWQFPKIRKLFVVLDNTRGQYSDDFKYFIPSDIVIYEASVSFYVRKVYEGGWSKASLDGDQLFSTKHGNYILLKKLTEKYLVPNTFHTVTISRRPLYGGELGFAVFFLYGLGR